MNIAIHYDTDSPALLGDSEAKDSIGAGDIFMGHDSSE